MDQSPTRDLPVELAAATARLDSLIILALTRSTNLMQGPMPADEAFDRAIALSRRLAGAPVYLTQRVDRLTVSRDQRFAFEAVAVACGGPVGNRFDGDVKIRTADTDPEAWMVMVADSGNPLYKIRPTAP